MTDGSLALFAHGSGSHAGLRAVEHRIITKAAITLDGVCNASAPVAGGDDGFRVFGMLKKRQYTDKTRATCFAAVVLQRQQQLVDIISVGWLVAALYLRIASLPGYSATSPATAK